MSFVARALEWVTLDSSLGCLAAWPACRGPSGPGAGILLPPPSSHASFLSLEAPAKCQDVGGVRKPDTEGASQVWRGLDATFRARDPIFLVLFLDLGVWFSSGNLQNNKIFLWI